VIAADGSSSEPNHVYAALRDVNPAALVCVGFEEAYMGFTVEASPVAVYDYDLCIDIVMGEGDITEEEAVAYFLFNTLGKCRGREGAPVFLQGLRT
jgi:hypothetical protein